MLLLFLFLALERIEFNIFLRTDNYSAESIEIYIALPKTREHQKIIDIEFTPKANRVIKKEWGQDFAYFFIEKINPFSEKRIKMSVYAEIKEYKKNFYVIKESYNPDSLFLSDDPMINKNSEIIEKISQKLQKRAKTEEEYIRLVLDTISQLLYYKLDGKWEPADKVIQQGHGSCSEYSFLFTALLRKAGIPTRFVGGTLKRKSRIDYTFHRWVEVYFKDKGWIPIDPQIYDTPQKNKKKVFMNPRVKFLITTVTPHTRTEIGKGYNYNVRVKKGTLKIRAFFIWKE